MESILNRAIELAQKSEISFSKYITANDTGATGGHQAGFHIHKNSWSLFFDKPREKGKNDEAFVTIKWQDDFETSSRFIYYGVGTRNEYRLTRFGKGFPFLNDDNVGDLLVICKIEKNYYHAYVLQSDDDIDDFFAALNLSPNDTNGIIPKLFAPPAKDQLLQCFESYLKFFGDDFPTTLQLAINARNCYNNAYAITSEQIKQNPDKEILEWLNAEFNLFKMFENNRYNERIRRPFDSVEQLVEIANTILNTRKSRAGKSLEHHLEEIFKKFNLAFSTQAKTEKNKKPDFLFPGYDEYQNPNFDRNKLVMLASKTTCKDRWRQILNEADKIKTKHLFTLQQGISKNQLEEMYAYDVCLVVPKPNLTSFPPEFRNKIMSLNSFVNFLSTKQG